MYILVLIDNVGSIKKTLCDVQVDGAWMPEWQTGYDPDTAKTFTKDRALSFKEDYRYACPEDYKNMNVVSAKKQRRKYHRHLEDMVNEMRLL